MVLLTKDLFSDAYLENILAFLIYAHCVRKENFPHISSFFREDILQIFCRYQISEEGENCCEQWSIMDASAVRRP